MPTKELTGPVTVETLARVMELPVLAPDHTFEAADTACQEAATYGFAAVCLAPYVVARGAKLLRGTDVQVGAAVGFPFGYETPQAKLGAVRMCIEAGAAEVLFSANLVALKSGCYGDVQKEIEAARRVTTGGVLKVVLEGACLNDREKARAAELAREAGADYLVTATGFGPRGARVRDVELLRRLTGRKMGIMVAGGVETLEQVEDFIRVGTRRILTGSAVDILQQFYESESEQD